MRESIKKCQQAGITVRMVTGDNLQTARSIAEKCGIISKGDKSVCVIEGPNFRQQVRDNDGNVSLTQHVHVVYLFVSIKSHSFSPEMFVTSGIMVSVPSPFAYYYLSWSLSLSNLIQYNHILTL